MEDPKTWSILGTRQVHGYCSDHVQLAKPAGEQAVTLTLMTSSVPIYRHVQTGCYTMLIAKRQFEIACTLINDRQYPYHKVT